MNDGSRARATERPRHPGRAVAELALRQHRVVTTPQLREIGFSRSMISDWAAAGHLHRLHRGVYAVGTPDVTFLGRAMAAVLAVGREAAVSHRSAASLWRLRPESRGPIEVTAPTRRRGRRGIVVHLGDGPVTTRHGIPVTTPGQTIVDLADILRPRAVEQALAIAERDDLLRRSELAAIPGRRGAGVIERLAAADAVAFVRSDLEEWLLGILRGSALPEPIFNAEIFGCEVDAFWPAQGLVVEVDGWKYHRSHQAFVADRAKQALLVSKGLVVLRLSGEERPAQVVEAIAGALRSMSPAVVRA